MGKFIISWDCGFGKSWEIVEASSMEEAEECAYEQWKEEAETAADYSAEPYSKERAIDECLIEEDDEE